MKSFSVFLIFSLLIISCSNNKGVKEDVFSLQRISSPSKDTSTGPHLFTDKKGSVYLSWIEKKGMESTLKFSILKEENWSQPIDIALGNDWFVNWADYPVVASDANGNMIAHFLEKSDTAKFTYDIKMMVSADNGSSWSNPKSLHDDAQKAEHGFVTFIPFNDKFFASWLDGRKTAIESNNGHNMEHHGEMTLRAAVLDKNGTKLNDWELDERVCDCCQTSVAITANGPIVVYRDRSENEIRDMSIVRYINGVWTKPRVLYPDNWVIKGCPVNGPRADAIGNNLAIAWFTMKDKKGQVKIIFSNDGGENFKEPIQIDEGNTIGRVDVVMLDEKTAMVSWMEGATIKAVKIHSDGHKETSLMIAATSEARASGFPQMTKSGNKIYFAWTDANKRTIELGVLPL